MIGGGCFGDGGIGGDGRGGSSDLFPSLTYPIVCSLPSRADPPSAAMGGADPVTSSPPSHIPSLVHPLLRGSTVGGDGRGGYSNLFPSRADPVVCSPPSPPPLARIRRRRLWEGRIRRPLPLPR
ncbi:Os12g0539750 [Oryza sativa Japonica Group]|uniref:Os12g0539750 protein n=2 Tax=Oryza sativa subsp. japonica TaxID=39947 RepID=C7J9M2_ORYSJ|nr:hypothetical protein OsJ_36379 [Oryza sativa Japonica Group]BAH95724.1 Os12g0539750 [Oryza sativa Japonica Group]BAT17484.1 Os12g0539750 [Oryza sativa Japonica Group]|eukprot:NP_001176996.1 Os12g0539750 [Oryza sativa Japonica Group]